MTNDLEDLIRRIRAKDSHAFERLYEKTAAFVFGVVLRIVGDRRVAEDVVQDVYLQVWRQAERFDAGRASGLAWMAMIARSRSIDRLRSDSSYGSALTEMEGAPRNQPVGELRVNPEEELSLRERREAVHNALRTLTPEQREAVQLAFFRGMSHSEIARATAAPLGTVKSRIRSAIGRLAESLGPTLGIGRSG